MRNAFGDQESSIRAVIKDMNARGGIAGRQIVPVFHDTKTAVLLGDLNAATEAVCADWTEDHQVFAAVNLITYGDPGLAACMARHQTPLIYPSSALRPRSVYARFDPYLYAPNQPLRYPLHPHSFVHAAVRPLVAFVFVCGAA